VTVPMCPARVAIVAPVVVSQSRAVLSEDPVRMRLPLGEKATAVTQFVCRRDRGGGLRVPQPALLSYEPVRMRLAAGEKARATTQFVCGARVETAAPVAASITAPCCRKSR
jgi:hypothetical protein